MIIAVIGIIVLACMFLVGFVDIDKLNDKERGIDERLL